MTNVGTICFNNVKKPLYFDGKLFAEDVSHEDICHILANPKYRLNIMKGDEKYYLISTHDDENFVSLHFSYNDYFTDMEYMEQDIFKSMLYTYLTFLKDYQHTVQNSRKLGLYKDNNFKISFGKLVYSIISHVNRPLEEQIVINDNTINQITLDIYESQLSVSPSYIYTYCMPISDDIIIQSDEYNTKNSAFASLIYNVFLVKNAKG